MPSASLAAVGHRCTDPGPRAFGGIAGLLKASNVSPRMAAQMRKLEKPSNPKKLTLWCMPRNGADRTRASTWSVYEETLNQFLRLFA